ncbi:MAG: DinB family protein [Lacibacter sp.]
MQPYFSQLTAYNHWANKTLCQAVLQLDEGRQQQIVAGSFPSLYTTILHMWDAESIWWQRMEAHSQLIIPSKQFNPTTREAVNGLLQQSLLWSNWVRNADTGQLTQRVTYTNSKGDAFTATYWEVIGHVCNHSTYHRGQLVAMLRQLGEEVIPQTDFIHWCRTVR